MNQHKIKIEKNYTPWVSNHMFSLKNKILIYRDTNGTYTKIWKLFKVIYMELAASIVA